MVHSYPVQVEVGMSAQHISLQGRWDWAVQVLTLNFISEKLDFEERFRHGQASHKEEEHMVDAKARSQIRDGKRPASIHTCNAAFEGDALCHRLSFGLVEVAATSSEDISPGRDPVRDGKLDVQANSTTRHIASVGPDSQKGLADAQVSPSVAVEPTPSTGTITPTVTPTITSTVTSTATSLYSTTTPRQSTPVPTASDPIPDDELLSRSIALPGSRSKKIWFLLPVCSGQWTSADFNARFRYVVVELKRAVDGHNRLRDRARFIDYDLRMVGPQLETAIPSILVKCQRNDLSSLKSLFKKAASSRLYCYSESSFLSRLSKESVPPPKPAFRLFYYASDTNPTLRRAGEIVKVVSVQSPSTLCGALIEFEGRQATIGLTLDIDGDIRALTVDHLFRNDLLDQEARESSGSHAGMSESSQGSVSHDDVDDTWYNDSDGDDDSVNRDSGLDSDDEDDWPEKSPAVVPENPRSEMHGKAKLQQPQSVDDARPEHTFISTYRIDVPSAIPPSHPYLDWACLALEVDNLMLGRRNTLNRDDLAPLTLQHVAQSPRVHGAPVYLISGLFGVRPGRILGSNAYIGSRVGQELCESWAVLLDNSLEIVSGECGSIVVDQQTLEVYGHLIGSDVFGHGCVVPLRLIIAQIGMLLDAKRITLPAGGEQASSLGSHTHQSPTTDSASVGTSNPVKLPSSALHLKHEHIDAEHDNVITDDELLHLLQSWDLNDPSAPSHIPSKTLSGRTYDYSAAMHDDQKTTFDPQPPYLYSSSHASGTEAITDTENEADPDGRQRTDLKPRRKLYPHPHSMMSPALHARGDPWSSTSELISRSPPNTLTKDAQTDTQTAHLLAFADAVTRKELFEDLFSAPLRSPTSEVQCQVRVFRRLGSDNRQFRTFIESLKPSDHIIYDMFDIDLASAIINPLYAMSKSKAWERVITIQDHKRSVDFPFADLKDMFKFQTALTGFKAWNSYCDFDVLVSFVVVGLKEPIITKGCLQFWIPKSLDGAAVERPDITFRKLKKRWTTSTSTVPSPPGSVDNSSRVLQAQRLAHHLPTPPSSHAGSLSYNRTLATPGLELPEVTRFKKIEAISSPNSKPADEGQRLDDRRDPQRPRLVLFTRDAADGQLSVVSIILDDHTAINPRRCNCRRAGRDGESCRIMSLEQRKGSIDLEARRQVVRDEGKFNLASLAASHSSASSAPPQYSASTSSAPSSQDSQGDSWTGLRRLSLMFSTPEARDKFGGTPSTCRCTVQTATQLNECLRKGHKGYFGEVQQFRRMQVNNSRRNDLQSERGR